MGKYLVIIILFYFVLSLQFSFNLKFNIPLIIILCYSLLKGFKKGAILGFITGFICDLISSIYFGCYTIGKTIVATLAGLLEGKVFTYNILIPILVVISGTLLYSITIFGILSIFMKNINFSYFLDEAISKSIYNACISPFVYIAMKRLL